MMEPRECHEYELDIADAQAGVLAIQRNLDQTQGEIREAQKSIEDLAIDACTLRVRMKELELDEELVKRSESEAIMDRIVAQKRLAEIGGQESAVRALHKALSEAKRELQATREETQYVMSEEKKFQLELSNLAGALQRCRRQCVKLQEDYSAAMRAKRESDAKLQQLCLFLQTDAPPSPLMSPRSPGASSTASTAPLGSPLSSPTSPFAGAVMLPKVTY